MDLLVFVWLYFLWKFSIKGILFFLQLVIKFVSIAKKNKNQNLEYLFHHLGGKKFFTKSLKMCMCGGRWEKVLPRKLTQSNTFKVRKWNHFSWNFHPIKHNLRVSIQWKNNINQITDSYIAQKAQKVSLNKQFSRHFQTSIKVN